MFRNVSKPVVASAKLRRQRRILRERTGSVTPFLAMSMILMLGLVGIGIDLMRDFQACRELEFAAQSAGLFGYSLATNSDGTYATGAAQANIANAITTNGLNSANIAECGPVNNIWNKPVTIGQSDIQFSLNPLDPGEFFLQTTARRIQNDALKHFFLPILATTLSAASIPPALLNFSTNKTVEVLGQPASRIGAAAPVNSASGTRAADFVGFGILPLALSNQQFAAAANPAQTIQSYTIDLVTSASAEYKGSAPLNHLKGCFINAASASGAGNGAYGTGQGNLAIDQLKGLLAYFAKSSQQAVMPAGIEAGSQVSAFDPADPIFVSRQTEVLQSLSQLLSPVSPPRFFIIPVLAQDPTFAGFNVVVGFARLQLNQLTITNNLVTLTFNIGESVPVRNAASATGFSNFPSNVGTQALLPVPIYPFTPRTFDPSTNGISIRPRGIVLAPAVSPRQISGS